MEIEGLQLITYVEQLAALNLFSIDEIILQMNLVNI